MKLADVKVGGTYLTRIGDELARVVVLRKEERPGGRLGSDRTTTRLLVRREEEQKALSKLRTAAALRPLPTPKVPAVHIKAEGARFKELVAAHGWAGEPEAEKRAARTLVLEWAIRLGHTATQQGDSFECSRCGASCAISGLEVRGAMLRKCGA